MLSWLSNYSLFQVPCASVSLDTLSSYPVWFPFGGEVNRTNERYLYYRCKPVGDLMREPGFPWHSPTIANQKQLCGTETVLIGRGCTTFYKRWQNWGLRAWFSIMNILHQPNERIRFQQQSSKEILNQKRCGLSSDTSHSWGEVASCKLLKPSVYRQLQHLELESCLSFVSYR
jgi:hypothetical protein